MNDICTWVILITSVILASYGFYLIFKGQGSQETGTHVIQRQLKGFALLIVTQLVVLLGNVICREINF